VLPSMFKCGYRSAFTAVLCLISTAASSVTIDFNGLPGNPGSPFTSYTQAGFTVTPLSGSWLVGQNFGNPPPFIFFEHPAVAGTTLKARKTPYS
jgi:hypothetical protein